MPQMTRRKFLTATGAVLGAAAMVRVPLTFGAGEEKGKPFDFALVSDNHLGRVGVTEIENLKKVVAEINASQAEFTLFTGDLVHAGQEPKNQSHYPEWKKIVSELKQPWHAVPGNHDPDALFAKHVSEQLNFSVDRPPLHFICFRDAKPNPAHDGIVTADQIDWLQSQIDAAAKQNLDVILVSHIAYHANSSPNRGWVIADGRDQFGKLLDRNRKSIRAFVTGHYHYGLFAWHEVTDGSPMSHVVLPSTSWNEDHKLAGHVDLLAKDYRPGYTLARYESGELVLRYKPIGIDATDALKLRTA